MFAIALSFQNFLEVPIGVGRGVTDWLPARIMVRFEPGPCAMPSVGPIGFDAVTLL
jgi:hypothetical protein